MFSVELQVHLNSTGPVTKVTELVATRSCARFGRQSLKVKVSYL